MSRFMPILFFSRTIGKRLGKRGNPVIEAENTSPAILWPLKCHTFYNLCLLMKVSFRILCGLLLGGGDFFVPEKIFLKNLFFLSSA